MTLATAFVGFCSINCFCFAQDSSIKPTQSSQNEPAANAPVPRLIFKPGQPIITGMQMEDIAITDDVQFAKEQVAAYPESPEASFILAVALTRTSMVEEALKEVRRARKLADQYGGPTYFDHMISVYEQMLQSYPNDNRIRYGLAWAYYMRAYVLSKYSKKVEITSAVKQNGGGAPPAVSLNKVDPSAIPPSPVPVAKAGAIAWQSNWVPSLLSANVNDDQTTKQPDTGAGHQSLRIPSSLELAAPDAVPQIKKYYETALRNLDELLAKNPDDIWARIYRGFLYAEYTGDLPRAMEIWQECQAKAPDNPAPYFFLGEGYLRQGNLKECLQNVSKAIALRSFGK